MTGLPVLQPFAVLTMCLLILASARLNGQDRQEQGKDAAVLMSGKWRGTWFFLSQESSGYVFSADLELWADVPFK